MRGNFLRNVFSKALPGALCVVLSVFYVYALTAIEPLSQEVISTLCVILAGCSSLAVLFRISRPFNMNRRIIFGAMCLMFVLCIIVPPLASWFMLVRLSPLQLLCAGVGIVLIPLVQNGPVLHLRAADLHPSGSAIDHAKDRRAVCLFCGQRKSQENFMRTGCEKKQPGI